MKEQLEKTYVSERKRIILWMKNRTGTEEAEDILHDIIVRSLVNLDSMEGIRDLTAWLWRAAGNAVIDVWRKRGRRKTSPSGDGLDELIDTVMESATDRLEREEVLGALTRAIDALPEEQREVIVAQGLSGETFQGLSGRTGIPVATLAARKRYALAKLRKTLAPYRDCMEVPNG